MGDTYETEVEGIRILPGQWRPHYPWEHIAWISPSWPCQDYVWLDFPEGVITDQGFQFISAMNPAIDPKEVKFDTLPAVAWRHTEDGIAYERCLPCGLSLSASLSRRGDTDVAMAITVANQGDRAFTGATLRTCLFLRATREFGHVSNANKYAHYRDRGWLSFETAAVMGRSLKYHGPDADAAFPDLPVAVCQSALAPRGVAMTWFADTFQLGGNPVRPCVHADPKLPDLAPGDSVDLRGVLVFYEGTPDALQERFGDEK